MVQGADSLTVSFVDNQAYEANLKGTDPTNDLAVIAVPLESISSDTMSQIKTATLGDSDALRVGEQVVAIGNALGYGQSRHHRYCQRHQPDSDNAGRKWLRHRNGNIHPDGRGH